MYLVNEQKMDALLTESDNISRHLLYSRTAPLLDINKFGKAVLEMQTEIRNQQTNDENLLKRVNQ